ncbi:50S ribosomal protein L24 [Candidatus Parcubacteria bacterium]|nr:MAG: 50S ribosomal protein L24 [Candidatus Parcubacteria bacterium]
MKALKIKKGDTVAIISGTEKGKQGKVVKVFPNNLKLTVEGINVRKKHTRARRSGQKGSIVEVALPVNFSKVVLICPSCKQKTKIGARFAGDKKVRVCKKCNQEFE